MVQNIFLQIVFTPINKYPKYFSGTYKIYSWTSKWMSEDSIKNPSTLENSFAPKNVIIQNQK